MTSCDTTGIIILGYSSGDLIQSLERRVRVMVGLDLLKSTWVKRSVRYNMMICHLNYEMHDHENVKLIFIDGIFKLIINLKYNSLGTLITTDDLGITAYVRTLSLQRQKAVIMQWHKIKSDVYKLLERGPTRHLWVNWVLTHIGIVFNNSKYSFHEWINN